MEADMIDSRRRLLVLPLFVAGLMAAALPALAQDTSKPSPVRIQGTIDKLDGQILDIKGTDGAEHSVTLSPETVITTNKPSSLGEIKAGDYVASAAVKGEDGKLHSLDLRIFPESMRGLGDGQRLMEDPSKTMTNAAVSEVVAAPEGTVLKVKFENGTSELVVGPEVKVTAIVVADRSVLTTGKKVFVMAVKDAGGTLAARRVLVN
jgi:hypothetical protein